MVNPQPVANASWSFDKIFGDADFIAAGQLVIPPNSRKPSKPTKDSTYVRLSPLLLPSFSDPSFHYRSSTSSKAPSTSKYTTPPSSSLRVGCSWSRVAIPTSSRTSQTATRSSSSRRPGRRCRMRPNEPSHWRIGKRGRVRGRVVPGS